MKISKLKYVFAFVLMVAISVVSANVQAAGYNTPIKLSTIVQSQLAAIVDGDEPGSTVVVDKTVKVFDTDYNTTVLGQYLNPVQFYTLNVKSSGARIKAYSLNVAKLTGDDVEFNYAGTSPNMRVGLGLAFGLNNGLSIDQLDNQSALTGVTKANSYATQLYLWLVNNGSLGTAAEEAALSGLSATEKDCYTYIRNSVEQSLLSPSYMYNSEADAKAHPIEMGWSEENQRYEVTMRDDNSLDTMALVNLAVQPGSKISYSKNGNLITFYSHDQVASVSNPETVVVTKSINGGRYVAGLAETTDGSQTLAYLTGSSYNDSTYYVSFYTNALKVKVQKVLTASATNSKTGDASVEGARYGVYSDPACTQLVEEIVTDRNGVAMTRPIEYKDYYVKELVAATGCKLNTQKVPAAAATATTEANGQRVVTVTSREDVIYGGFRMIVSITPDLNGNTTKDPSVGSEITLTLDSDPTQKYVKTVDATGYVDFTNIPYGHYTCTETKRPEVEGSDKVDLMDPIDIFINSEETFIYSKIVNTEVARRYVKIIKEDAESGMLVTGSATTYRVENSRGETVVQRTTYPEEIEELALFKTEDSKGVVYGYVQLPQRLPADTYKVYEVTAPEGYYNPSKAKNRTIATFVVEPNSPVDYDRTKVIEVKTQNKAQKAILTISARGNVLTGTNTQSSYGQDNVQRPAYTSKPIPGAVYELTAQEDIVTGDGKVHMNKGQTITLGTTDENGKLSAELYLGTYTIKMVAAPAGYAVDSTERTITATYQGELVETYPLPTENYTLVRQDYDLDVTKVFTGLNFYKQKAGEDVEPVDKNAYADVIVGIYAAEDIRNVYGQVVIAKDTLVDVVIFNEEGKGTFASEYPMGKFYAKEIATNQNYKLSTVKYAFETKPGNDKDARFNSSVGEIVNEALKETKFELTKIEEVVVENNEGVFQSLITHAEAFAEEILNGPVSDEEKTTMPIRLEGAKYAVYYLDDDGKYYPLLEKVGSEFVEVVRTTDENGIFTIEGLPFGGYAVKEVEAPRYYNIDERYFRFALSTVAKEQELVLQDVRKLIDYSYKVKDEDGNPLPDVKVELVDPDTNEVVYETVTDEDGVATFEDIRAGRYIVVVDGVEETYVKPAVKEDYLEEDPEEDNVTELTVKFVVGNILINKTDDETGEAVAGCKFQVKNEAGDVVAEEVTDENGQILVTRLRYGVYYVEEVEAAEGYEKSDLVYEVTITENDKTYVVDYTNVPTGDIAVALYAIVTVLSVAAITVTVKKLRKN